LTNLIEKTMPRTSNTEFRKQQIIQGLMTVMSKDGYEGSTIPLIAEAAGLTPGLIHYHFDNKESILLGLIEHLGTTVNERFVKLSKHKTNGKARLTAFIDAHLKLGKGADPDAVACWISIGAEAVRRPDVRNEYQRVTKQQLAVLEALCEEALFEGGHSTRSKRQIALTIYSAIEGAYRLLVAAPDLIVPGFAAPSITQMATGLISAQPKAK